MREQVAMAAAQSWREPVWALWLGRAYRARVSFEVPGLRYDGTVRGDRPAQWFFARLPWTVAMVLGYTVTSICSLFWFVIQAFANQVAWGEAAFGFFDGTPLNWRRKVGITAGAPFAGSVAAGRQLVRKRGQLWLVFSNHGTAFTQVVGGRQEVLWADNSPNRPVFVLEQLKLCWPDGSAIDLVRPGHRPQPMGPYPMVGPG